MTLGRRAHIGLDLALPKSGEGLEVMDLPEGSPLKGRVAVGDRLIAIDGQPVVDLDGVRELARALQIGERCELQFENDEGAARRVECVVEPLPTETIPGSRVVLRDVLVRTAGRAGRPTHTTPDDNAAGAPEVGPDGTSTAAADHRLRSIWTFPEGDGPHPLVWLLPGATWLSDEHVQEPWHPTLKLVRALARLGFATLRVDRSGVGDSEGPPCTDADLETELGWWRAAHRAIGNEPRVDPQRLFLFGRSLGGVLAQLIGAEVQPRGVALWGTTSRPWHDAMIDNARRIAALQGMVEPALSEYMAKRNVLAEAVYLGETPDEVRARLPELSNIARVAYDGTFAHGRSARFFQQLQSKDVAAACRAIRAPVLVMRGELDWISGEEDAASIVAAARNPTFLHFEGVDHLMHRREGVGVAFTHIFGGDFDPSGAEAMAEFFGTPGDGALS